MITTLLSRLKHDTTVSLSWFILLTTLLATWLTPNNKLLAFSMALFFSCIAAVQILVALHNYRFEQAFGPANQITLLRLGITVCLLSWLCTDRVGPADWVIVIAATIALGLDGVDGYIARKTHTSSDFGARFDMETDALMILVLCFYCAVWQQAGWWIVLAGLYRYLFIAAAYVLPWLGRALPPSRRRQTACVIQILSLLVCLIPGLPRYWAQVIAGSGLVILTISFVIDVRWLFKQQALST